MQLGGPLLCALNWETVVFWCPTYQQSWQLPTVHQKQMFQRCNKNASLKVQILVWVDQKKDVRCIDCYTESCRSAFPFIQSTAQINSPNFCRPRLTAKRRAFKFVFIWKYSIFFFVIEWSECQRWTIRFLPFLVCLVRLFFLLKNMVAALFFP